MRPNNEVTGKNIISLGLGACFGGSVPTVEKNGEEQSQTAGIASTFILVIETFDLWASSGIDKI